MAKQYLQLDFIAENRPIELISIFSETKPAVPGAPMFASVLVRGKDLGMHIVELLPLLEDYKAFLTWDPSGIDPNYNFAHFPAEHAKAAAAAIIRWLHEKKFLNADEAKQAATELRIPETIPVLSIGFSDRILTQMRERQSDTAKPR